MRRKIHLKRRRKWENWAPFPTRLSFEPKVFISQSAWCERANSNAETVEKSPPFFSKSYVWLIAQIRSVGYTGSEDITVSFPSFVNHRVSENKNKMGSLTRKCATTLFWMGPISPTSFAINAHARTGVREKKVWRMCAAQIWILSARTEPLIMRRCASTHAQTWPCSSSSLPIERLCTVMFSWQRRRKPRMSECPRYKRWASTAHSCVGLVPERHEKIFLVSGRTKMWGAALINGPLFAYMLVSLTRAGHDWMAMCVISKDHLIDLRCESLLCYVRQILPSFVLKMAPSRPLNFLRGEKGKWEADRRNLTFRNVATSRFPVWCPDFSPSTLHSCNSGA